MHHWTTKRSSSSMPPGGQVIRSLPALGIHRGAGSRDAPPAIRRSARMPAISPGAQRRGGHAGPRCRPTGTGPANRSLWDLGAQPEHGVAAWNMGIARRPATAYDESLCRLDLGYPEDRFPAVLWSFGRRARRTSRASARRQAGTPASLTSHAFAGSWSGRVSPASTRSVNAICDLSSDDFQPASPDPGREGLVGDPLDSAPVAGLDVEDRHALAVRASRRE